MNLFVKLLPKAQFVRSRTDLLFLPSSPHLLLGPPPGGGGSVVRRGGLLSSRGAPAPRAVLGHRAAGQVPEPHQRRRSRVHPLLPPPDAQHEREAARLPGVSPRPGPTTQDLQQPGGQV